MIICCQSCNGTGLGLASAVWPCPLCLTCFGIGLVSVRHECEIINLDIVRKQRDKIKEK
jgi:hypothetical protein